MRTRVNIQKTRVIQSKKDSSHGEQSAYWDYFNRRKGSEDRKEFPQANPDSLPETEIASPSTPQLLLGEAIEHMQGRQKEVYLLTMREDKSLAEVAEILQISKGSVQVYQQRAIKFLTRYCREAIKRGRV
jgi:RNA polymerase sigma factor (sigma-70 family)